MAEPAATQESNAELGQYKQQVQQGEQERRASVEREQQALQDKETAEAPKRAAASEAIGAQIQNLGNVPEPPKIAEPPKITSFFDKDVGTMLLTAASIIAGIGVGNGKVRGIRAMSSLTGSIQGYIGGNLQAAYQGLQDYRSQMEQQIQEYMLLHQKFKDTIESGGKTIEMKMLDLQLAGAPADFKMLQEQIGQKSFDGTLKTVRELGELTVAAQRASAEAKRWEDQVKQEADRMDLQRAHLGETQRHDKAMEDIAKSKGEGAGIPTGAGGGGNDVLAGVDPGTAAIVKQLADYRIPLPSGFALRSPYWQRILGLVSQYDPTFDASQYNVRMKLRSDFASGKAAANIRSLNTAVQHLNTLSKAANALDNSPIQLWNKIANTGITQTGDPRVTNFNTAAAAVESELATVFKGTAGTDQEIKVWRQGINAVQSPEQLNQGIEKAIELMSGRIHALSSQYETGMGRPKDFKMLSDGSRKILQGLGIDPAQIDPVMTKSGEPGATGMKRGTSKSGKPIISKDDGQTWEYE